MGNCSSTWNLVSTSSCGGCSWADDCYAYTEHCTDVLGSDSSDHGTTVSDYYCVTNKSRASIVSVAICLPVLAVLLSVLFFMQYKKKKASVSSGLVFSITSTIFLAYCTVVASITLAASNFYSEGSAIRNNRVTEILMAIPSAAILLINLNMFQRVYTSEKHPATDPQYRKYATYQTIATGFLILFTIINFFAGLFTSPYIMIACPFGVVLIVFSFIVGCNFGGCACSCCRCCQPPPLEAVPQQVVVMQMQPTGVLPDGTVVVAQPVMLPAGQQWHAGPQPVYFGEPAHYYPPQQPAVMFHEHPEGMPHNPPSAPSPPAAVWALAPQAVVPMAPSPPQEGQGQWQTQPQAQAQPIAGATIVQMPAATSTR